MQEPLPHRCLPAYFGRRAFLRRAAALGAGALLPLNALAQVAAVRELSGTVLVNGRDATPATLIRAGDTVYTTRGASLWFTLGGDAYFLRAQTELRLEPARVGESALNALRLLTGALGATFARGVRRSVITPTATIGIRGTGVYIEAGRDETYACTCFGSTELMSSDERMMERVPVTTVNHLARRIPRQGNHVEAPFERHTNEEMARLERYAGRPDPFIAQTPRG
jgi:hypothetical protein